MNIRSKCKSFFIRFPFRFAAERRPTGFVVGSGDARRRFYSFAAGCDVLFFDTFAPAQRAAVRRVRRSPLAAAGDPEADAAPERLLAEG